MQSRKALPSVSVIDAVDFLSDQAERHRALPADQTHLKEVLSSVLRYMQTVATKQQLKEDRVRQGLHALMAIARGAMAHIEALQGRGSVALLQEAKDLEAFYSEKIAPHMPKEGVDVQGEEEAVGGHALREIEKVRQDGDYELFLIRSEGPQGYFTSALSHLIQQVAQFDALVLHLSDEQPFKKLELLTDQQCHEAAKAALKGSAPLIDLYYKEALKFKQLGFVSAINKGLMALMLAANPRNQLMHTIAKPVALYYRDFHSYLREAFSSAEYLKLREMSSERSEHFLNTVMQLSLQLCSYFFLGTRSKRETVLFIRSLMKQGDWLEAEGALRAYFKQYPSAPLLKTAEALEREEWEQGFDPLSQGSYPSQLYTIKYKDLDVSVLRLPSPTHQEQMERAQVAPEFRAWIRSLQARGQRHLLINLQDRTSWKESARCTCLEEEGESAALCVVTLAKWTDFYHQSGPYAAGDDAVEWMKLCKEQLLGEQVGFYFPDEIDKAELGRFIEEALGVIVGGKTRMTQPQRRDGIDLLYLLLTLKLAVLLRVDSLSFTCKDGIDLGAAMDAQLFAFLKKSALSKEEVDGLLWMLYAPALLERGRVIDQERFQRVRSSLEGIQGLSRGSLSELLVVELEIV